MQRYCLILLLLFSTINSFCQMGLERVDRELEKTFSVDPQTPQPVIIVMKNQADKQSLNSLTKNCSSKKNKALVVTKYLKQQAQQSQQELKKLLDKKPADKVKNLKSLWLLNAISCNISADILNEIRRHPDIAYIIYDPIRNMLPEKWDPQPVDARRENVWGVEKVNADKVWNLGYDGSGVVVAIIDSGVNYDHTDIKNNMWDGGAEYPHHGYDFANGDDDPADDNGHGSHCAGTVAGYGTNGYHTGMAPKATIMAVKTMNAKGGGSTSNIVSGIQFAAENGADIISLSLGTSGIGGYYYYRIIMENLLAMNIVACVAASNDGGDLALYPIPNNIGAPGNCPPPWLHPDQRSKQSGGLSATISVGATFDDDTKAFFSSIGPATWTSGDYIYGYYNDYDYVAGDPEKIGLIRPDIAAPGVNIISLSHTSTTGYTSMNGTSMATPCASGVVALMLQAKPNATPALIDSILECTAVKCSYISQKNNFYGSGRIDALAAVNSILSTKKPTQLLSVNTSLNNVELQFTNTSATNYQIFRDNTFISSTTNTSYTDNDVPSGNHFYHIVADYSGDNAQKSNSLSIKITGREPLVRNLKGSFNAEEVVNISWTAPTTGSTNLDNPTGSPFSAVGYSGTYPTYWGFRYNSDQLIKYAGKAIYEVKFYCISAGDYTCNIFRGNPAGTAELLFTKSMKISSTGWYTISIPELVAIPYFDDLWITFTAPTTITHPATVMNGTSTQKPFISPDGTNWSDYNYPFAININIKESDLTYSIVRNNDTVAKNITSLSFSDENFILGENKYKIFTNYKGGQSLGIVPFTLVNLNDDATVDDLSLGTDKAYIVNADKTLTVDGTLSNSDVNALVVRDGGQVITDDVAAISVEKNYPEHGVWSRSIAGWYLLGVGAQGVAVSDFVDNSSDGYDLYRWVGDNVQQGVLKPWYNYRHHNGGTSAVDDAFEDVFVVGRGYLTAVKTAPSFKAQGTTIGGTSFDFGPLTYSDDNLFLRSNLLGNPFPYNVDWADFSKTNVYDGFADYDAGTGAVCYHLSGEIKNGCGFFVSTTDETPSLSYSRGSSRGREHVNSLSLAAISPDGTDQAIIRFDNETTGFPKIDNLNTSLPSIFFERDGKKYGILSVSEEVQQIPVAFTTPSNHRYTLRVNYDGDFSVLFLLDNLTGEKVDLLADAEYLFTAGVDDNPNRFTLILQNTEDCREDFEKNISINIINKELIINTLDQSTVKIYNLLGHLIYEDVFDNKTVIATEQLGRGVFIVDVDGKRREKVVL